MTGRVVALTPAWNSAPFIERTLESLAAQTYGDLQVLISDDASTDDTFGVSERFAARDPRFRVFQQRQNLGWVRNANFLLDQADGDFLFFAFHDDVFDRTFVEAAVERMAGHPDASIVFSDLTIRGADGAEQVARFPQLDGVTSRLQRTRTLITCPDHWWLPVHGLFRAAHARKVAGLRHHLLGEFSADWPWLVRMALLGEFERIPDPLCTKQLRAESVAAGWRFMPRFWYAAAASCAREVLRADITAREKQILLGDLLRFCFARRRESSDWMASNATRGRSVEGSARRDL